MNTPVPSTPVGPLARALVEALESVAARDQVRSLVRGALLTAKLDAIPEDAATFRRFTQVALRAGIERSLGAGTADIVLEQLEHVVATMAPVSARRATGTSDEERDELSGERNVEGIPTRGSSPDPFAIKPRARPDLGGLVKPPEVPLEAPVLFPRATSFESGTQQKRALARVTQSPAPRPSREIEEVRPSSSGPRALATDVVVISLDPRVVSDVEERLRGRSRVRGVVSAPELVAAIASMEGGRVAIVLDTGVPSIDLPTFVGLVPAFPPGTHVVLWGTDDRHKARLVRVFPQVAGWSASNACESPVDVLLAE